MSLYKYSFWDVLMHSFSAEVWAQVLPAISETMYMVGVSSVFLWHYSGAGAGNDQQRGAGAL